MIVGLSSERGLALVVAMLMTMMMMALAVATLLAATTETLISAGFRQSREAVYAADGAAERVLDDLESTSDWNAVLDGSMRSSFIDGASTGVRDRKSVV